MPTNKNSFIANIYENRKVLSHLDEIQLQARQHKIPAVTKQAAWFLCTIIRLSKASRILEIGTGNGYSGLCIETALTENGQLVTVENDLKRIKLATRNFADYSNGQTTLLAGNVLSIFKPFEYFDMIFIDGRKYEYPDYLSVIRNNLRPGGTFLIDNAFFQDMLFNDNIPERFSRFVPKIKEMFSILQQDSTLEYAIIDCFDGMVLGSKKHI